MQIWYLGFWSFKGEGYFFFVFRVGLGLRGVIRVGFVLVIVQILFRSERFMIGFVDGFLFLGGVGFLELFEFFRGVIKRLGMQQEVQVGSQESRYYFQVVSFWRELEFIILVCYRYQEGWCGDFCVIWLESLWFGEDSLRSIGNEYSCFREDLK